jgi:hypothetical protein
MIEIIKNTFVDIHYEIGDRKRVEQIVKRYEKSGYTKESDDYDCIQMLSPTRSHNVRIQK